MSIQSHCHGKEDLMALEYFGDFRGRFLDLGAYDGRTGSTTYALLERGWVGVHVEPNWRVVGPWIEHMRPFLDRVRLVHGAIGLRHRIAPYWDSAGPWSTCDPAVQACGVERTGALQMFVPTFTPADLADAFPGPFDMVSIDIEGWSLDVMRAFPWSLTQCRFAVIEAMRKQHMGVDEVPAVIDHMASRGFRHLATTDENVVMVR